MICFLFTLLHGWNSIVSVSKIYIFYCIKSLILLLIKTKHLYNPGYMLKLCKVLVTVQFPKTKTVLGTYDHGQNILEKL